MKQLIFQQTYSLFLWWLLITQTDYQNIEKGCGILPQGKGFLNSRKLIKVVAVYKTDQLILSKKSLSLKTRGSEKVPYLKSSCSKLFFV